MSRGSGIGRGAGCQAKGSHVIPEVHCRLVLDLIAFLLPRSAITMQRLPSGCHQGIGRAEAEATDCKVERRRQEQKQRRGLLHYVGKVDAELQVRLSCNSTIILLSRASAADQFARVRPYRGGDGFQRACEASMVDRGPGKLVSCQIPPTCDFLHLATPVQ